MIVLVQVINTFAQILVLVVILSAILSYFMDPYHPVRQGIDNIVRPLLDPIRRVVPPIGMLDLSPLILVILIQVVSNLLTRFLIAIS